ncbi:hypothetical protein PQX77_020141 [Marasmius sp. AFHP31]|nr:hypothetical protein PQX77_020141 [Marasmius sp. AFHP31]
MADQLTVEQRLRRAKRRHFKGEKDGQIYMIRGRLQNGDVIWKVGRSVDGEKRVQCHRAHCKIERWTSTTIWDVANYIRTEACIHLELERLGFQHYEHQCPCGTRHNEWFTYPDVKTGTRIVRDLVDTYEKHH